MDIAGSTIILTGASSGIGAELGPLLAERGARLGLVARRADRLEEVLERCLAHTPGSRIFPADLADIDRAEDLVREAWEAFDGFDCLVNNAAMGKRKHLVDMTVGELDQVMQLNFFSPIRMAMVALDLMRERGSGLIVNVASMGGRLGIAHESAYCAAKFAMCGWTEVAHIDLFDSDVDVAVKLVLPGPIDTEIWEVQPGDVPHVYEGPMVSAAECAASVVDAIADDGFEFYVPPVVEAFGSQHELVVGKTNDVDSFLTVMGEMAKGAGSH